MESGMHGYRKMKNTSRKSTQEVAFSERVEMGFPMNAQMLVERVKPQK